MESFEVSINEKNSIVVEYCDAQRLDVIRISDHEFHCLNEGKSYQFILHKIDIQTKSVTLELNGKIFKCDIKDTLDITLNTLNLNSHKTNISKDLVSTMPGMVLKILVQEGQEVEKGDTLMILEAMKMENVLKAGTGGHIEKICCSEKAAVDKGQLLIEIS